MVPDAVSPTWATSMSAPASAIITACRSSKTYGAVNISIRCASRTTSTSLSYPIPVASRSLLKLPSMSPTVGKFWIPEKPISLSCFRNTGIRRNGSVPQTPSQDRRVPYHGKYLGGHLHDDPVGVPVRHETGQRAATRHAISAGVVDDDEVRPTRLGALGGDARAGAASDDGPAGGHFRTHSLKYFAT